MVVADPWYDYFVFPYGPLLLGAQATAWLLPRWWMRVGVNLLGAALVFAMYRYLESLPPPRFGEGVDLGTPLMGAEAIFAGFLLAAAIAREIVESTVAFTVRRRTAHSAPKNPA